MIVTPCGHIPNDADCSYCLQSKDCREVRANICQGCRFEGICPVDFRHKRIDTGECRGRELIK